MHWIPLFQIKAWMYSHVVMAYNDFCPQAPKNIHLDVHLGSFTLQSAAIARAVRCGI